MALKDQLSNSKNKYVQCTTCLLLQKLSTEDADTLNTWIENGVQYELISDALRKEDHDVNAKSLSRHFRGRCTTAALV